MLFSRDGGKFLVQKYNEKIPTAPSEAGPVVLAHLAPSADG